MAIGVAPGLAGVQVFEAPNTGNAAFHNDILASMATTLPLINQLSSSWFFSTDAQYSAGALRAGAAGPVLRAGGGRPGLDLVDEDPGDIRDLDAVTVVGGTTLTLTGAPSVYGSEAPWNAAGEGAGGGGQLRPRPQSRATRYLTSRKERENVLLPLSGRLLLGVRVMPVVHPLAFEGITVPEPRELVLGALGFLAPVLGPLDVRPLAEDVGLEERADVHPDAVVEVGVPADGLLGEGLPADENVVRRLAGQGGSKGVAGFFLDFAMRPPGPASRQPTSKSNRPYRLTRVRRPPAPEPLLLLAKEESVGAGFQCQLLPRSRVPLE